MNLPNQFNLKQRFYTTIFIGISLASILIIGLMYWAISQYATKYVSDYWAGYTKTFADAVKYPVIIGSAPDALAISQTFAGDKNVKKTTVYTNKREVLATIGETTGCSPVPASYTYTDEFIVNTGGNWCFFAPIAHESHFVGHVELVISKAGVRALLLRMLIAIGLTILLFSAVVFLIVSKQSKALTSTLLDMESVLKAVSQGASGARVSFAGPDNIAKIRDGFNDMLAEIEQTKQLLEQRVIDRTLELEKALEGSQAANVYKSQIMMTITHEMKTPLHAISMFLQTLLLLPEGEDLDSLRPLNLTALARANDMKENIDTFLLKNKLAADKHDLNYSTVDIMAMMQKCADKISVLKSRNQNRLVLSNNPLLFVCDAEMLMHIVNNLLSNACKFTQNGIIHLNWWQEHGRLSLQVCDTGRGISAENRSRIFADFWQEDMGESRKHGGHGLGLYIVKQFVNRLQGEIVVTENVGKGSIFTVTLPGPSDGSAHLL
jgi:signal transduction histidine kinase